MLKTSELIKRLVDSLSSYGDLPTNIKNLSWYCPSENGSFEKVILNENHDKEKIVGDRYVENKR